MAGEDRKPTWQQRERDIYSVTLGGVEKKFDPAVLFRRYQAAVSKHCPGQLYQDLQRHYDNFDPEWKKRVCKKRGQEYVPPSPAEMAEAQRVLSMMGRDVFDEKPFEPETETGMQEWEAIGLMTDFLGYLEVKKKKAKNSSTASHGDGPLEETAPTTNTFPCLSMTLTSVSGEQKQ